MGLSLNQVLATTGKLWEVRIISLTMLQNAQVSSERGPCMFEFFSNSQSWQLWHFCTSSNGNKLKTVKSPMSYKANLHF